MPSSKLHQYTIWYENSEEYHHLKNEIFTQGVYYFETDNPRPRIIDAGAHIGLATLYFKRIYPGARVTAIEPLPQNFALLEKNIWENQLDDVETHPVALSTQTGTTSLFHDATDLHWNSTAGFTDRSWNGTQTSTAVTVPTQTLAHFLTEPIDFLKMDIEGAEQAVLQAAGDKIRSIKHLMLEYHPIAGQSWEKFTEFLQHHGFRIQYWKDGKTTVPKHTKGLFYIEATRS